MAPAIRAVTFDLWNTVLFEPPGALMKVQVDALEDVLSRSAVTVPRAALEEIHDAAFHRYLEAWSEEAHYSPTEAADYCASLIAHHLGGEDGFREELVERFLVAPERAELEKVSGVGDALAGLRARGIDLAIISDVGLSPGTALADQLRRHGLAGYFRELVFSDRVGAFKPSATIFGRALDALGIEDPSEAAHVGDIRRTDVAGAKAAGMHAIRCAVYFDDPDPGPEGDRVVRSYADLGKAVAGLAT